VRFRDLDLAQDKSQIRRTQFERAHYISPTSQALN
jgi:hypothetical protein